MLHLQCPQTQLQPDPLAKGPPPEGMHCWHLQRAIHQLLRCPTCSLLLLRSTRPQIHLCCGCRLVAHALHPAWGHTQLSSYLMSGHHYCLNSCFCQTTNRLWPLQADGVHAVQHVILLLLTEPSLTPLHLQDCNTPGTVYPS